MVRRWIPGVFTDNRNGKTVNSCFTASTFLGPIRIILFLWKIGTFVPRLQFLLANFLPEPHIFSIFLLNIYRGIRIFRFMLGIAFSHG